MKAEEISNNRSTMRSIFLCPILLSGCQEVFANILDMKMMVLVIINSLFL
jgi:hypothetical protein